MRTNEERQAAREYAEELVERLSGAEEAATAIFYAFTTDAGKKALAELKKVTIESPAWVPGQSAEWGYFREGQNDLVRRIEQLIGVGRKLAAAKGRDNG